MRGGIVGGAVFLLALGCTDITGPTLPIAERFDPPPTYRSWWIELRACAARVGSLDAVRFHRVIPVAGQDSLSYRDPESGRNFNGVWVRGSNSIYLAAGQLHNSQIVRHEMLHALLRDVGHPPRYFKEACGPLVAP